jgi:diguanylate cyclase (GGDEF)-like protein
MKDFPENPAPQSEFAKVKDAWHQEIRKTVSAAGDTGEAVSVLLADLNNLKWTNDTIGHHAGDTALHLAMQVLANYGNVVRIGGDEFGLIIGADEGIAELIAEQVKIEYHDAINDPEHTELKDAGLGLAVFERIQKLIAEELSRHGIQHRERDFGRFILQQVRRRRT